MSSNPGRFELVCVLPLSLVQNFFCYTVSSKHVHICIRNFLIMLWLDIYAEFLLIGKRSAEKNTEFKKSNLDLHGIEVY